jgi:microcystin-dependent protein
MQPDLRDYPEPIPSFQEPATPPDVDPTSGVLLYRCYSEAWQAAILGALQQLLEGTTWDASDPAQLLLTQQRADTLIGLFMMECDDMPTGAIIFFAGATPPDGYLVCNGTAISRANYAALFAVCGTAYGVGDGATTFNLPDLGGRLPMGAGQQTGGSDFHAGDHGGEETHKLTVAEMPAHSHSDSGHSHSIASTLPDIFLTGELPGLSPGILPGYTGTASANIQGTGGDGEHNTLPPYLALLPCIRY